MWDDKGNIGFLETSSGFSKNTYSQGILDAGAGLTYQYTELNTIYDLKGIGSNLGASIGLGLYIGGDAIVNKPMGEAILNASDPVGWQATVGYGYGFDWMHEVQSNSNFMCDPSAVKNMIYTWLSIPYYTEDQKMAAWTGRHNYYGI